MFLTPTSTRHSLLYKHKHFRDKTQTKLVSTSNRLTGESREAPIDVEASDLQIRLEDEGDVAEVPGLLREESDDDDVALGDIPELDDAEPGARRSKRRRGARPVLVEGSDEEPYEEADEEQDYEYYGDSAASDDDAEGEAGRPAKRPRDAAAAERDDKKKLAMEVSYEGFAIYGRVLCLVVGRRGGAAGQKSGGGAVSRAGKTSGHAMMEHWIASTQLPAQQEADAP